MSLAVKYRPQTFNDVVGQESTVKILKKQIQSNDVKNTYIFEGASGCGKTTLARIFARELNNADNSAIEIDGASNNGVENVREIVKSASERSLNSIYKIFIIDEAHMLSKSAWNALLKTIEEPSKYTIFIFCSTEPNKIPDTIKNRCQRFRFTKIPSVLIKERLKYICCQENFTDFEESCDYISKNCKNQMRDAITLLEQVSDYSTNFNIDSTIEILGGNDYKYMFNIINAIIDGNISSIINNMQIMCSKSIDTKSVVKSLFDLELDINKFIVFNDMSQLDTSSYYLDDFKNCTNFENSYKYHSYILEKLLDLVSIDSVTENFIVAYLIKISRFN